MSEFSPQFPTDIVPDMDAIVIDHPEPCDQDERRSIIEVYDGDATSFQNARFIVVEEPVEGSEFTMANHWETDVEIFYIMSGAMKRLALEDIVTKEQRVYENLEQGTRIYIPPFVAHRLDFVVASTLYALTETPYAPGKWKDYDITLPDESA